jgi:anti-sigma regulatory factor (Ser/Thr protein kinase)
MTSARRSAASQDLATVTPRITALAHAHPEDLPRALAGEFNVGLPTARRWLRQLAELGWVRRSGPANRPHYQAGSLRQAVHRYALDGLDEDRPWRTDFAPYVNLPASVAAMIQYAFTELVNNAIDHSEGTQVTVSLRQTATQVQLLVSDNGRGLFDKIREGFDIDDPALALLELSKGRLTSQPDRHTGRGLFYAARMADVLDLHANAVAFQHREWAPQQWVRARAAQGSGSAIYMAILLDTQRTLDQVMRSASVDGQNYNIEHIVLPMRLLTNELVALESRAQARRVAARLESLREASLDFSGVERIGQGFADELFRVIPRQQSGLRLQVCHANTHVQAMIDMALQA